jgi:hypothetical protein
MDLVLKLLVKKLHYILEVLSTIAREAAPGLNRRKKKSSLTVKDGLDDQRRCTGLIEGFMWQLRVS